LISFTLLSLYTQGKILRNPLDRRLGEPQLDVIEKIKISCTYREPNPESSVFQPVS
jgi:hypothetical protein